MSAQNKPDTTRGEVVFYFAIVIGLLLGILIKRIKVGIIIGIVLGLLIVLAGTFRTRRR